MALRKLTKETRNRVEEIIMRLRRGEEVSLEERIQLNKYSQYIPFISGKVARALKDRSYLDIDENR